MIVFLILFFLFSFLLALRYPTYYVIFYFLISTKFLGFFSIESYFIVSGTAIAMPVLNVITLLASIITITDYQIPKKVFQFITVFLTFLIFGIIYPAHLGFESISQAIIASKEFWSISILIYLTANRVGFDKNLLIKVIEYTGLYLALIYIIYIIFKLAPPAYATDNYIRVYYPTYISLAAFLYYRKLQNLRISLSLFLITEVILFTGIVIAGHLSLFIGTLFSLGLIVLFYINNKFDIRRFLFRSIVICSALFVILVSSSNIRNTISNKIDSIIDGTDVALTSRDTYNNFRWQAISERPMLGYGFIHKSSHISQKFKTIENNRFAESFGVIDSGYVDLIVKFGYLGALIFLLLWGSFTIKVLLNSTRYQVYQIIMAAYLLQYFLVSYTWSLFTFSHGLIPAFLAIYLMDFGNEEEYYYG